MVISVNVMKIDTKIEFGEDMLEEHVYEVIVYDGTLSYDDREIFAYNPLIPLIPLTKSHTLTSLVTASF